MNVKPNNLAISLIFDLYSVAVIFAVHTRQRKEKDLNYPLLKLSLEQKTLPRLLCSTKLVSLIESKLRVIQHSQRNTQHLPRINSLP